MHDQLQQKKITIKSILVFLQKAVIIVGGFAIIYYELQLSKERSQDNFSGPRILYPASNKKFYAGGALLLVFTLLRIIENILEKRERKIEIENRRGRE